MMSRRTVELCACMHSKHEHGSSGCDVCSCPAWDHMTNTDQYDKTVHAVVLDDQPRTGDDWVGWVVPDDEDERLWWRPHD